MSYQNCSQNVGLSAQKINAGATANNGVNTILNQNPNSTVPVVNGLPTSGKPGSAGDVAPSASPQCQISVHHEENNEEGHNSIKIESDHDLKDVVALSVIDKESGEFKIHSLSKKENGEFDVEDQDEIKSHIDVIDSSGNILCSSESIKLKDDDRDGHGGDDDHHDQDSH